MVASTAPEAGESCPNGSRQKQQKHLCPGPATSSIWSVAQLRRAIGRVLSRDLVSLSPSWQWRTTVPFSRRHVESGTRAALSAPWPPGVPGPCRGAAPPLPPGTPGTTAVILLSHRPTLLLSPGPAQGPHSALLTLLQPSTLFPDIAALSPGSCPSYARQPRRCLCHPSGDSWGQPGRAGTVRALCWGRQCRSLPPGGSTTAQLSRGCDSAGRRENGEKSWDRALLISFTPITFSYVFRHLIVSFIYKNVMSLLSNPTDF